MRDVLLHVDRLPLHRKILRLVYTLGHFIIQLSCILSIPECRYYLPGRQRRRRCCFTHQRGPLEQARTNWAGQITWNSSGEAVKDVLIQHAVGYDTLDAILHIYLYPSLPPIECIRPTRMVHSLSPHFNCYVRFSRVFENNINQVEQSISCTYTLFINCR